MVCDGLDFDINDINVINKENVKLIFRLQLSGEFNHNIIERCLEYLSMEKVQKYVSKHFMTWGIPDDIKLKYEIWDLYCRDYRFKRNKIFNELSKVFKLFDKKGIHYKIKDYVKDRIDNPEPEFRKSRKTYPNFVSSRDYFNWIHSL
jgi:hypothetical protein